MPNASTIRRQVGGTQQLTLAPIPGILTTPTAFQLNNNALSLTGGGVVPLSAGATGIWQGTNQVLHVAAFGNVVGKAGTVLTLYLYQVPASALPILPTLAAAQNFTGWNLLAQSSSRSVGAITAPWSFDARLQLDAAGNLDGQFTDEIASLVDVYYSTVTAVLAGEQDLNFVIVAAQTTAAATSVTMKEFRLDLE